MFTDVYFLNFWQESNLFLLFSSRETVKGNSAIMSSFMVL